MLKPAFSVHLELTGAHQVLAGIALVSWARGLVSPLTHVGVAWLLSKPRPWLRQLLSLLPSTPFSSEMGWRQTSWSRFLVMYYVSGSSFYIFFILNLWPYTPGQHLKSSQGVKLSLLVGSLASRAAQALLAATPSLDL